MASVSSSRKTFAPVVTRRKDTGPWPASFLRGLQLMHLPLGFTFKANGEDISIKSNQDIGLKAGYSYHLFDGIDIKQWGRTGERLKKEGNSYIGAFSSEYPEKELPQDLTIPLVFTHIGGIDGEWKFNVPVHQIPVNKIKSNLITSSTYGAYTFKMESVIRGIATTIINYHMTMPEFVSKNLFHVKVVDDYGNELSNSRVNSQIATFSKKVDKDSKYIIFILSSLSLKENE